MMMNRRGVEERAIAEFLIYSEDVITWRFVQEGIENWYKHEGFPIDRRYLRYYVAHKWAERVMSN